LTPQQRIVLDTVQSVWRNRGATEREVEIASAETIARFQNRRVYLGRVLEHGEAPFENDPKNERSYFVKLARPEGEKVVWGVDLPRALEEGGIKTGDEVVIANQGRKQVQVPVKTTGADGKASGTTLITATRNTWRIDTIESFHEEARAQLHRAAARADRAPVVPIHDRHAARSTPRPEFQGGRNRDRDEERLR
jgi:putative DNA primase/helicase